MRRGFSLINVVLTTSLTTVLLFALLSLLDLNTRATHAGTALVLAQKAADAGYRMASRRIYEQGFCDVRGKLEGKVGPASYEVSFRRSGRVCFIRSVGSYRNARVVVTGIVQAFYGVGLYTVRGNVEARLGEGVRLSGCDYGQQPACVVPAFIASGAVETTLEPKNCCLNDDASVGPCGEETPCDPADGGGPGVYGHPAVVPFVPFTDLIPLFFNVNCFNAYAEGCEEGLLEVLEREYGAGVLTFQNPWGVPTLPDLIPEGCSATGYEIDLSAEYAQCDALTLERPGVYFVKGTRQRPLKLVVPFERGAVFLSASLPEGSEVYSHAPLFLSSSPSCREFYTNRAQSRTLTDYLLNEAGTTGGCFYRPEDA
ncbi:MAG: hypothetical protein GXO03_06395, partial [Aquificae bacterium]|nr:hypothetical protein [Aquificota bacterium]